LNCSFNVSNASFCCATYCRHSFDALNEQFKIQYPDLTQYLEKYSGLNNAELGAVDQIASASYRERIHNKTQPAWLDAPWKNSGMSVYELLMRINTNTSVSENSSQQSNRLLAGILLNDIVMRTVKAANNTVEAPGNKMTLYSSHEGTVGALMENMGIRLDASLPYAVAFMIDLYYASNTYYVQLSWSRDQQTQQVLPIVYCNNAAYCTLDEFVRGMGPRMLTNKDMWKLACDQ